MVRVRVYKTMRIAKVKYLEYCEHNIGNIEIKRFNARGSGIPVVLLKNNDFVLFMSYQIYSIWCIGRMCYDDFEQCYKRSGFKISKELADELDRC